MRQASVPGRAGPAARAVARKSPEHLLERRRRLGPAQRRNGVGGSTPAVVVVLPVEYGLPLIRRSTAEARNRDTDDRRVVLLAAVCRLFRERVHVLDDTRPCCDGGDEAGLLA